jgi:hypothetical protein
MGYLYEACSQISDKLLQWTVFNFLGKINYSIITGHGYELLSDKLLNCSKYINYDINWILNIFLATLY